jgi:hypothetical protein
MLILHVAGSSQLLLDSRQVGSQGLPHLEWYVIRRKRTVSSGGSTLGRGGASAPARVRIARAPSVLLWQIFELLNGVVAMVRLLVQTEVEETS